MTTNTHNQDLLGGESLLVGLSHQPVGHRRPSSATPLFTIAQLSRPYHIYFLGSFDNDFFQGFGESIRPTWQH